MPSEQSLLVVDDDDTIVKVFERLAAHNHYHCTVAKTGLKAVETLATDSVDVAIVDLNLPGFSGLQLLEHIRRNHPPTEVIMVTAQGTVDSAVRSLKMGAYDYLTKPFDDMAHVERIIARAFEKIHLVKKIHSYEMPGQEIEHFEGLIGKSPQMREIYQLIQNISHSTSNILITGESGTGKELVARAIHRHSPRKDEPFVVINCAALSEPLLESELFGHVKGAFTSAIQDKQGLFTVADGGTIFLDEVGDIPPSIQVKLLRVLQNGEVRPLGSSKMHHVDVRVVAATNRNLAEAMKRGAFREDLFYRLHVIGIRLPSLAERREDIPLLAYHFLKKSAQDNNKEVDTITIDAMQALQDYPWVGNVRELENVIERAVVLCSDRTITAHHLPSKVLGVTFYEAESRDLDREWLRLPYQKAKRRALSQFNHRYIEGLLQQANGNISLASQRAGMDRNNFRKIIRRYEIDAKAYKKGH